MVNKKVGTKRSVPTFSKRNCYTFNDPFEREHGFTRTLEDTWFRGGAVRDNVPPPST